MAGKKRTRNAKKSRVVARSAKTGKFVKKSYAKKHSSTTTLERLPRRGSHGDGNEP